MVKLAKSFLLFFLFLFIFTTVVFAAEDSVAIATYYPSPYGSYNELATNRLAIGDTNNSGGLDANDQPNRDGDIRLKAQTGNPATWPAGTTGQFAYSSTQDSLYHYNGTVWAASGGGGGGCYVSYSGSCLAGFTNKGSAGDWGNCYYAGPLGGTTDSGYHFRPAGGSCSHPSDSSTIGNAYVCCQ